MHSCKIAIFVWSEHGHVNPVLSLMKELVVRGVDVVCFATSRFASSVEATGARFVPYSYPAELVAFRTNYHKEITQAFDFCGGNANEMMAVAHVVLDQVWPILREERPDAVLYDTCAFAGRFARELLSVPGIMIHTSYPSHGEFLNYGPQGGPDHRHGVGFRAKARKLTERYGVAYVGEEDMYLYSEPLTIAFMAREFHPVGSALDGRVAFVGPQITARLGGTYTPPTDGRPLVYISLGTEFYHWPGFFRMCLEALGGKDWNVLMAIAKLDASALGSVPSNVRIEPHVPQLEVLSHARVFVTHGGMNSIQESLWFGVPMVVIPQMPEQATSARRIVDLQLGQHLERSAVTPISLLTAIEQVSRDPTYAAGVARMQNILRGTGGPTLAAELVIEAACRSQDR